MTKASRMTPSTTPSNSPIVTAIKRPTQLRHAWLLAISTIHWLFIYDKVVHKVYKNFKKDVANNIKRI